MAIMTDHTEFLSFSRLDDVAFPHNDLRPAFHRGKINLRALADNLRDCQTSDAPVHVRAGGLKNGRLTALIKDG